MRRRRRVMAVASAGGHWVQLFRMRLAWAGCETVYVTTRRGYEPQVFADAAARGEPAPRLFVVPEANRWQRLRLAWLGVRLVAIMARERPDVVVSTGAAPGYFALRLGRLLGARAIWVDSIANAEELSLSGRRIGRHADVWLTQWEDLARPEGPHYWGAVL